jgi:hypothetical protein
MRPLAELAAIGGFDGNYLTIRSYRFLSVKHASFLIRYYIKVLGSGGNNSSHVYFVHLGAMGFLHLRRLSGRGFIVGRYLFVVIIMARRIFFYKFLDIM